MLINRTVASGVLFGGVARERELEWEIEREELHEHIRKAWLKVEELEQEVHNISHGQLQREQAEDCHIWLAHPSLSLPPADCIGQEKTARSGGRAAARATQGAEYRSRIASRAASA